MNRSELHTRLGLAQGVTFPRVLGIEATGVVADGEVAPKVREIVPTGVEVALELVGTPTLPDTLRATAVHGVVCFTGMLSNQWTVRDFYPIDYLPRGVRLAAYSSDARDLPSASQRHMPTWKRGTRPANSSSLSEHPTPQRCNYSEAWRSHVRRKTSGSITRLRPSRSTKPRSTSDSSARSTVA